MDDEKASSAPRREGEVTPRRARSAPPAVFVEPKSVVREADTLPIDVPEAGGPAAATSRPPRARKATPPRAKATPPAESTPPAEPPPPATAPRKRVTKPRAATDPAVTKPAPTDASITEPTPTEPALTKRALTERAAPEPRNPEARSPEPRSPEPRSPEPAKHRPADRGDWRSRTPKPAPSRPSQVELWSAVRVRPALAPAALAVVAVDRFGPVARERARWLADTYPRVPAARLARVAVREASTRARYATAAGLIPLGGVLGLSTQLWAHSRMVLEIAAAFGQDPCADDRAADLLALLRIYPDVRAARAAVAVLTILATEPDRPSTTEPTREPADPPHQLRAALTRSPVVGAAGIQLARRAAKRWFPGSALVLDGLSTASATEALANRTIRFYRDAPHG